MKKKKYIWKIDVYQKTPSDFGVVQSLSILSIFYSKSLLYYLTIGLFLPQTFWLLMLFQFNFHRVVSFPILSILTIVSDWIQTNLIERIMHFMTI